MAFINVQGTKIFSLFLMLAITALLISCGTSKRSMESENISYPSTAALSVDSLYSVPGSDSTDSVPVKVLISPAEKDVKIIKLIEKGKASWYGPKFNGKLTADGEQYDMYALTAAHRTLPFNTLVLVQNMDTGKSVLVRINDRGPFAKNRIIDLSKKAARQIGMIGNGTANVRLYVAKNALNKSRKKNLSAATYTVQLGSFDSEAQAFTYSSKIKGSRVEIVRKEDKTFYRVYYGLFIDKKEAAKKQRELERKNISGYVKQIENG